MTLPEENPSLYHNGTKWVACRRWKTRRRGRDAVSPDGASFVYYNQKWNSMVWDVNRRVTERRPDVHSNESEGE